MSTGFQGVDGLRLLIGARALLSTRSTARLQYGREGTPAELAVLRVLGVRQVVQSVLTAATGLRTLLAAVDVLHALSMLLPLAVAPRRLGRFALIQLATATTLAVLGARVDRR